MLTKINKILILESFTKHLKNNYGKYLTGAAGLAAGAIGNDMLHDETDTISKIAIPTTEHINPGVEHVPSQSNQIFKTGSNNAAGSAIDTLSTNIYPKIDNTYGLTYPAVLGAGAVLTAGALMSKNPSIISNSATSVLNSATHAINKGVTRTKKWVNDEKRKENPTKIVDTGVIHGPQQINKTFYEKAQTMHRNLNVPTSVAQSTSNKEMIGQKSYKKPVTKITKINGNLRNRIQKLK